MDVLTSALAPPSAPVSLEPFRIYTGILGQIGDIVMFTATARRIKELFPNSRLTFAVCEKYREAGELVAGLPYIDRLFVTRLYFDRMTDNRYGPWHMGWPVDLRGEDEVAEQRSHDMIFETRPRHRRMPWWKYAHQVEECAHMVGVPGLIDLRTEVKVPENTPVIPDTAGKIVVHNDPSIDATKAWPWPLLEEFVRKVGPERVVVLGTPGSPLPGTRDLRGYTTLTQAAAIIQQAACYVGVDPGLMWIAGSLGVPTVGLYGTSYVDAYQHIQPINPHAIYLQAEGTLDSIFPNEVLNAVKMIETNSPVRPSHDIM